MSRLAPCPYALPCIYYRGKKCLDDDDDDDVDGADGSDESSDEGDGADDGYTEGVACARL